MRPAALARCISHARDLPWIGWMSGESLHPKKVSQTFLPKSLPYDYASPSPVSGSYVFLLIKR